MDALLKKLNFKAQNSITVFNSPEEFNDNLASFKDYLDVKKDSYEGELEFCIAFVINLEQIKPISKSINELMVNDGLFWFAYPKKSSKKYKSDISRDDSWQSMGDLGYEPVRMVALNEDWSALRFRKVENIKTMTRNPDWIMSEAGKNKIK